LKMTKKKIIEQNIRENIESRNKIMCTHAKKGKKQN
jgi:hypothetical protein